MAVSDTKSIRQWIRAIECEVGKGAQIDSIVVLKGYQLIPKLVCGNKPLLYIWIVGSEFNVPNLPSWSPSECGNSDLVVASLDGRVSTIQLGKGFLDYGTPNGVVVPYFSEEKALVPPIVWHAIINYNCRWESQGVHVQSIDTSSVFLCVVEDLL